MQTGAILLLTNYITVYPTPPPQSITQSGDTLFAIAGATTYQWYFNSNIINGATNYFYVAPQSGDYNVVATDANGCEVEAANVQCCGRRSYLSVSRIIGALIFPNPVGDKVTIQKSKVKSETAVEISIYNMLGEMVLAAPLPTANCQLPTCIMDVSQLARESYYIEIVANRKNFPE